MKFCYTASILAALTCTTSAFVMPSSSMMSSSTRLSADVAKKAVESETGSAPVIAVAPVDVEEEAAPAPVEAAAPIEAAAPAAAVAEPVVEEEAVVEEEVSTYNPLGLEPGRYANIDYSVSVRSLPRPPKLTGDHAGDFGFDPLGFTDDYDLYYLQECEIRHARLAMLAVVGWPLSELVAPSWMLQEGGRAPSVLNGVNPISALAILTAFAGLGYFEYATSLRRTAGTTMGEKHRSDMSNIWEFGVAGDYNFDPLNLYSSLGNDAQGRKGLRELELVQGRYAMLGITSFALWEKLTGHAIVENSMFFHPNALLPALALGYFGWSQIYEVSPLNEYPIKIQYTKDGEEILNGLERNKKDLEMDLKAFQQKLDDLGVTEQIEKLELGKKVEALELGKKVEALKEKITSIELE